MSSKTKRCFVIAPIGEEHSETRHRSDQIMSYLIQPAAEECGYNVTRADSISKPGVITSQIIERLLADDLVVADLTGHNPNVFYELAIRHAVRKPVVQLIQKGEPIPFDVSQSRTIQVDHHDLDSVHSCLRELTKQIRAAEKNPNDVDTPISMAIDVQNLKRSGNPLEKSNAEIISLLQDIRYKIDVIARRSARVSGRRAEMMRARESLESEMAVIRDELAHREDKLRSRVEEISAVDKSSPKYVELKKEVAELGEIIDTVRLGIMRAESGISRLRKYEELLYQEENRAR